MAGEGFSKGGQAAVSIVSAIVQVITTVIVVLAALGFLHLGTADAKAAGTTGAATAAQLETYRGEVVSWRESMEKRVRALEDEKTAREAVQAAQQKQSRP